MATAVEYGLVAVVISVAAISAVQAFSAPPSPREQREAQENAFVARCHNRGGFVVNESTNPVTAACAPGPVLERYPVRP